MPRPKRGEIWMADLSPAIPAAAEEDVEAAQKVAGWQRFWRNSMR